MKLVKQSGDQWHYRLNEQEAQSLCAVVESFPVTVLSAAKISKTDSSRASVSTISESSGSRASLWSPHPRS